MAVAGVFIAYIAINSIAVSLIEFGCLGFNWCGPNLVSQIRQIQRPCPAQSIKNSWGIEQQDAQTERGEREHDHQRGHATRHAGHAGAQAETDGLVHDEQHIRARRGADEESGGDE